ncbi:MAG: class I SAM-dependent methyltransferase [Bacteroidota bacterium]|nr:class I SAM-dependent methyltransferase [Bacteroidota bacterium]
MPNAHWDERFSQKEYYYGTDPNEFFKTQLSLLKPGRLLLLGEGEGRNAVYAAQRGWRVDAVDESIEGKKKALALAKSRNTTLSYTVQSLETFNPKENMYDAVGLIFIHMPEILKKKIHAQSIAVLKPGGRIILEAFDKEQITKTSGGPRDSALLYSTDIIAQDFHSLQTILLEQKTVELSEGKHHRGEAIVVRFVGEKK